MMASDKNKVLPKINSKYSDVFKSSLANNEKLLWVGKHARDSYFVKLAQNLVFVITYTIATVLIAFMAISQYGLFLLLPILFALTVQKFVSLVLRFYKLNNTIYAISDQQLMSKNGQEIKTIAIDNIVSVELKTRGFDKLLNTGTVVFHNDNTQNYMFENVGLSKFTWFGIKNPNQLISLCKPKAKDVSRTYSSIAGSDEMKVAKINRTNNPVSTSEKPKYGRNSRIRQANH